MEVENKKIIIPSPVPFYESLVSVKENTDKKLKKKKKEKKNNNKQTESSSRYVQC